MTNKIFKNEILDDEQLEQVAGGNYDQYKIDVGFFMQLDYDVAKVKLEDAFAANGVRFTYHSENVENNEYRINGVKHPHWAALGYVLSKRNYPGFNGKWTDAKYVSSFMKEHFHITDFG